MLKTNVVYIFMNSLISLKPCSAAGCAARAAGVIVQIASGLQSLEPTTRNGKIFVSRVGTEISDLQVLSKNNRAHVFGH